LKPAPAYSLRDSILKKPFTEKGWWSGSRCRFEFKPQYCKKNKTKQKLLLRIYTCIYIYINIYIC
jgi:hypothetical protein